MLNIDSKALYFRVIGESNIRWFNGREGLASSPFHSDSNPSFSFNVESGLSYDFSTGKGYNEISLLKELHKCTYKDAVEYASKNFFSNTKLAPPVVQDSLVPIKEGKQWGYSEIVGGGLQRRKQGIVVQVTEISELDAFGEFKNLEIHSSFFNHSSALLKYKLKNKGSIAGYRSKVKPFCLIVDFDSANIELAKRDLLGLVSKLKTEYRIKQNDITVFFSGNKGFHLYCRLPWINSLQPSLEIPLRIKQLVSGWKKQYPTIDENIYKMTSLIRIPNSIHPKTGLYKVPLTLPELRNSSISQIKCIAQKQRRIKW